MLFTARTSLLLAGLAALATTTLAIKYDDVQMLCLVNKERKRAGLKPLGLDPKLTAAARKHSQDQARRRKMSHTGGDGSKPSARVTRAGFKWKSVAENVAYGYKSMEEVMRTWMKSPGHRKNILSKSDTMFGSGMALAGSTPYFTQNFASDGKPARNVPKCDGSDGNAYGGAADQGGDYDQGGDDYGSDNGGDYGGDDSGGDYGSSKGGKRGRKSGGDDYGSDQSGGDDYGSSKGGKRGRKSGGDDYSGGDDDMSGGDYGSEKGGKRGGRGGKRGGRGGKRGGKDDKDCDSKKGRGGRKSGGDY